MKSKYSFLLCVFIIKNTFVAAQSNFKKSIGVEFGISPRSKNIIDSGNINPIHRNNKSFAINYFAEKAFKKNPRFYFGYGIRNAIVFRYDNWNPLKSDYDFSINRPITGKKFNKGYPDFYTMKLTTSFLIKYKINNSEKNRISFTILPDLTLYYPMEQYNWFDLEYPLQVFIVSNNSKVRTMIAKETIKGGRDAKANFILRPEITFMLNCNKMLNKKNKVSFDLSYHIGAKNLQVTKLIFYPDLTEFTSKMHYSQNNNYASIAIRYFFNSSKKAYKSK